MPRIQFLSACVSRGHTLPEHQIHPRLLASKLGRCSVHSIGLLPSAGVRTSVSCAHSPSLSFIHRPTAAHPTNPLSAVQIHQRSQLEASNDKGKHPKRMKQMQKCFSQKIVRLVSSMENSNIAPKKMKKCLLPLAASLLLSTLLIFASLFSNSSSSKPSYKIPELPLFVESKLHSPLPSSRPVPRLAYLISGSVGDGGSLKRTLRALYHPLNQYVVHLDLESPPAERMELAEFVMGDPVFAEVGNVRVVVRANLVTYRGPTMVANTLHAAAILLKEGGDWDWFINLSASDYPLVTQDDLLHTLSGFPRDLNFLEHTSDIGWKEFHRAKPLIIDPGLYSLQKSDVFWVSEKRSLPTAFKLFTGSAWMMLSRPFIDYCVWGWDNLPRTVLMYYANFLSSPEGYFHTVICNAQEFCNTTVNHDLHFISWDNPPKQHPHFLTVTDFQRMVDSNAPFARKFHGNDPVLDKIDKELLGRDPEGFVPGGWFRGKEMNASDMHYVIDNITELRPGPGAERLKRLITGLLSENGFGEKHCI